MKLKKLGLTICPLFLLAGLWSHHSWALPTRTVWIPQAHVLGTGTLRFDHQTFFTYDKKDGDVPGSFHETFMGVEMGVAELGPVAIETGFDWHEGSARSVMETLLWNFRARVNDLEKDGYAVALGIEMFGFKTGISDFNMIYLLIQNKIGSDWSTGLGGFSGNDKLFVAGANSPDNQGAFFGVWRQFQGGRGSLGFEWQSGRNFKSYLFSGLKIEVQEGLVWTAGLGLAANRSLYRDWLTTGFSLSF